MAEQKKEKSTKEQIQDLQDVLRVEEGEAVSELVDWLKSSKGEELKSLLDHVESCAVPGGNVEAAVRNMKTTLNAAVVVLPSHMPMPATVPFPAPNPESV